MSYNSNNPLLDVQLPDLAATDDAPEPGAAPAKPAHFIDVDVLVSARNTSGWRNVFFTDAATEAKEASIRAAVIQFNEHASMENLQEVIKACALERNMLSGSGLTAKYSFRTNTMARLRREFSEIPAADSYAKATAGFPDTRLDIFAGILQIDLGDERAFNDKVQRIIEEANQANPSCLARTK